MLGKFIESETSSIYAKNICETLFKKKAGKAEIKKRMHVTCLI